MKKFLKIFFAIILLGAFAYTIYFLFQKSQEKPLVFESQTAEIGDIIKKTTATGSVIPRKEIEIKPQVSGIIDELFVEEGDHITKGSLIARVKIIPNMVQLNEAEARLKRAKIQLADAQKDYTRNKGLLEKEVISQSMFEDYEVVYNNAVQEVETAEDNLALIREGQKQNANESSNTLIRSTIEGMVLEIPVEIGNSVIESNTFNAGTTIATVADMNDMIFEGNIDESEVGKIEEGMPMVLTIGALEDESFVAILEHISPKGTEENGAIQFKIKAEVSLRDSIFVRANYSANAAIELERRDSVLQIKESLLLFDGKDSAYVEIEKAPQEYEKRYLKTGLSDGINIEIIEGLSKEDKIKVPNSGKPMQ